MVNSQNIDCFGCVHRQRRGSLAPIPLAWVNPGVFALIGAGAFMGGVTRLTIALVVIIMEMSSEVHFVLPIMTAIMTAK